MASYFSGRYCLFLFFVISEDFVEKNYFASTEVHKKEKQYFWQQKICDYVMADLWKHQ